jgi:hypothetical protein
MLRILVLISMVYDLFLGAALLAASGSLARAFGAAPPTPPILANLLGLFAFSVGLCYLLPLRDPVRWRPLLWVLGPVLKGGGCLLFLGDHFTRRSPDAFLAFGVLDGFLALWTAWALWRTP